MSLSFANPLGLWALLGIPAVVAIHFLQRRSRRVVITTLFLLRQMRRESQTGSRIERLRFSIPFWLQLLMVLVFTWLLVQPRWLRTNSVQRIAIVLDSSASMSVFRAVAAEGVADAVATFVSPLARAELSLLTTDPEAPALYHGASVTEMLAALSAWDPLLGVHDFAPALRAARSLAGGKGVVLLVTDHALSQRPPFDARVISVGAPTANVGWAGVTVESKDGQWFWRAMVRNYSRQLQEREWYVEAGGSRSPAKKLTLRAGEMQTLSGPFPEGAGVAEIQLVLGADAFHLDDRLPLVRPAPKVLGVHVGGGLATLMRELFGRYEHVRIVDPIGESDLAAGTATPDTALPEQRHACLFLPQAENGAAYLQGSIVTEAHPLVEGLNWQGLLVRAGPPLPPLPQDRVLVWQGERPLVSLRQMPAGGRQLICQFDLETSNARKLPVPAVMLHRFLESIRKEKLAPEAANFDVRQRLEVAFVKGVEAPVLELITRQEGGDAETLSIDKAQARLLRAPARPGFFEVRQGGDLLLKGAAHFADTREADLEEASAFDELPEVTAAQVEAIHEADPNWRLWLLLLTAALLGSWWFADTNSSPEEVAFLR